MDDPASPWLLLFGLVLLGLSAFFSASETAVMGTSRLRLRYLAESGDRRAQLVIQKLADRPRFLAAILVGNNMVNIALTSILTAVFVGWWGEEGLAVAMLACTLLILMFGEILPKALAAADGENTALAMARPLGVMMRLLAPIAAVFHAITALVLRGMGRDIRKEHPLSQEELELVVDAMEEHGVLDQDEKDMIQGIIQFADTSVQEIMVPRPDMLAVPDDTTVGEASQLLLSGHFSRLPVFQGTLDHVSGFVHLKDLVRAGRPDLPVGGMVRPVLFIPETRRVDDLFRDMRRERVHLAIALDEHGSTSGLVTLEDLLEEIVGDIRDEYDEVEEAPVLRVSDGVYLVSGKAQLKLVCEELGVSLGDDEVDTVGGLVFHRLGRLPRPGDTVREGDALLTVEEVHGRRVTRVKLELGADSPTGLGTGRS
jgi:CBS domain containing-hemolysin-like protein